jgi:rRNA maturation RNase YbeY
MITIKNTQRKIPIDKDAVYHDACTILSYLGYTEYDLGIWFTSTRMIRSYNKMFRGKDKVTDILSFPFHEDADPDKPLQHSDPDLQNLGDLIIAPSYVDEDRKQYDMTRDQRLKVILVHGICHLFGYDHISDADYEKMHHKEQELLAHITP